ncbi:hypothetical protein SBI_08511 [Streptomyces bingchenggensis BCW-1]|uniref:Uncharacterized protein n=1 Tax=Streptomyces bingchenggensis (strain BCW-1) TaxID=749414 RepID=D7BU80_STRBB|nr:hypothetical protein SBI_08511 [Streptomyces bingchenggensis BCW-1]
MDMQGYSQILEAKMAPVRSDLDDVLTNVLAHIGLQDPRDRPGAFKDTGDGAILVMPAKDIARLVDPLLEHLHAALVRYDHERLASAPAIRLRAALHVGPLSLPDHRGDAINEVCRLLDSKVVRTGLTVAREHRNGFLAAVLSEAAFRRTVRAGRTPDLDKEHFLHATARVDSKAFEEPCWLFVPQMTPRALAPLIDPALPGGGGGTAAPTPSAGPSNPPGAVFQINGEMTDTTLINKVGTMRIDRRRI